MKYIFPIFIIYLALWSVPFYILTLLLVTIKRLFTSPKSIFQKTDKFRVNPKWSIFYESFKLMIPDDIKNVVK